MAVGGPQGVCLPVSIVAHLGGIRDNVVATVYAWQRIEGPCDEICTFAGLGYDS